MSEIPLHKWTWLAALTDGEGSFSIFKRNRRDAKNPTIECHFTISNTDKRLLLEAQKNFGGSLNGPYSYSPMAKRPHWVLTFSRLKIKEILPELLPYLISKRERGTLLLEAARILNGHRGGAHLPYEPRLLEIFYEMSRLENKAHVAIEEVKSE